MLPFRKLQDEIAFVDVDTNENYYKYNEAIAKYDQTFESYYYSIDEILSLASIEDLGNLSLTNNANNHFLVYDNSTTSWVNKQPSDALISLGITATSSEINYLDITTLGTSEASKAITVDASGDLTIPDSDKFQFGAGLDMTLYHDGTDSYITNKTGALKIATETSGIAITIGHTTSEVTVSDNLNIKGDTLIDNGKSLRLSELDTNGSHYIAIKAPDAVTSDVTLVLPDGIGTDGQALVTNNSGVLRWASVSGFKAYSSKTATFTAAVNNHYSVNTTSGAIIANLPQISTTSAGESLVIKFKAGTNTLTLTPYSGNTIEGLANLIMTDSQSPGQSITLISDGTSAWEII